MQYRPAKGMNDILPDEIDRWHHLESTFRRIVERCRYAEVRTPVVEPTSLFVRSIGEATDVVEKEMYSFAHSSEHLTLRPEGTAGAVRAYLSNQMPSREPVTRWYYLGPMFRAERPQKGRYRQFYQAGCELFGDPGPICDAELIDMLVTLLRDLGVGGVEVHVNSIGGHTARAAYRDALLDFLRPRAAELSEHARGRLEANPLRVLDSKHPQDQQVVQDAPSVLEVLPEDDLAHWDGLRRALDVLETPYNVAPRLVRGLDYYTRTLFEITATGGDLGAQNTLLGGGRYDGLVRELGGPTVPAIGFAMGIERILLAMDPGGRPTSPCCYVAPFGQAAQLQALEVARDLRATGVSVDLDGRGNSLKSMLRRADSVGARVCLVIGPTEAERGMVQVKDLVAHTQQEIERASVTAFVGGLLQASSAEGELQ